MTRSTPTASTRPASMPPAILRRLLPQLLLLLALAWAAPLCHAKGSNASATALTSSSNPAFSGSALDFTATVTVPGTTFIANGNVTFFDGTVSLGTQDLDANGVAVLSATALTAGLHNITATFNGGTEGSTGATERSSTSDVLIETIYAKATVETQASLNPAPFGQTVTFTVTVSGPGTPTGTVTFSDEDGLLGSQTLDGTGTATLSVSTLAVGQHSITAVYGGDTYFTPATAKKYNEMIVKAASITVVKSSRNPATFGQTVVFKATVSGPPAPTGTVTFNDGGADLGDVALDALGTAQLTVSGLAEGAHSIAVTYRGDGSFNPSTSAVLFQFVNVAPVVPPMLLTSNPNHPVLSPAYVPAGSPDTTLTIAGKGFSADVQVSINSVLLDPGLVLSVTTTQIVVTVPAALLVNPGALAVAVFNPGPVAGIPIASIPAVVLLNVLGAEDVTAQTQVAFLGQRLDRASGLFLRAYRLTNQGSRLLPGALSLVLDHLTNATMTNAVGVTKYKMPVGSAYVTADAAPLAPGESVTVQVALAKTGPDAVAYTPRVLAGLGAR